MSDRIISTRGKELLLKKRKSRDWWTLILNEKRRKEYFWISNTFKFAAIIAPLFLVIMILKDGTDQLGKLLLIAAIISLILLFVYWALYKYLQHNLKFRRYETRFDKTGNYAHVKRALTLLNWEIKVDNHDFIEARTKDRLRDDFRTWGNNVISILILDHQLLVHSLCSFDTVTPYQAFSWGKNRDNIEKFMGTFYVTIA
jgi:hypothetical protein